MKPDRPSGEELSLHVVVLGEVLWDIFPHAMRLGGAPLNFGVHARRLGHPVCLLSAVGSDDPGRKALEQIAALQLDTRFLQTSSALPTGTASVELIGERATFKIHRPAAYDAIGLAEGDIAQLRAGMPAWLYYGTLFAATPQGRAVLERLLDALATTVRFYDLNLRPGFDSPDLVNALLERANVVKLNEEELERVHGFTGLPSSLEAFCREGVRRYGWHAVAVTRGSRGCALLAHGQYIEAEGFAIDAVDPVGAGDAFGAAFMHGLSSKWPASEIAAFANRVGALVASRDGAIPDWTMDELVQLS
ncbi:MAG TPA: carbohydrate kinase [Terriglobia bacterium]|nr:carbohydrate kinase [Terriglobia bacterium]